MAIPSAPHKGGSISVRESRAGDDFHVLWAARQTLRLLDPADPVSLIRIEGLSPDDADDDDERFLGCDLSEYDGGANFGTSTAVRLVQLKYSTKHPNKMWTAAELARKPSQGQSVIKRLAAMHAALVEDVGRVPVLEKVTVSLVSNRPVASSLLAAVADFQALLTTDEGNWTKARLFRELGVESSDELTRLLGGSSLAQARFLDFLSVLDLTQCGAGSRRQHLHELHRGVSGLVLGPVRPGVLGLRDLVIQQVMPEARQSPGIGSEDVLAALGAHGRASLFPYPSDLRSPDDPVPTTQAADLAAALLTTPAPLLAHGILGIGKTTTVLRLEAALPAGSKVVVFDCFADGNFHLPNQERHSYRACLQLANDVAIRMGLEPVVTVDSTPSHGDLYEALRLTLAKASPLIDDGAVLVLAIDAADNTVITARQRSESCFVDGLWDMALPPNVRILMTCRTLRREDVTAAASKPPRAVELRAFDAAASAAMLRRIYPDAGEAVCTAFHSVSHGVARVQSYALGRSSTEQEALNSARSGLPAIFDEILQTALSTTVDPHERTRRLAALAVAGRPAATHTVADVLAVPREEVETLVHAMRPALDVVADRIRFADEDFDAHLSSRIDAGSKRAAHRAFADLLWSRRDSDVEAAVHVAMHLDGSGLTTRLLELARDEGAPEVIADGFLRTRTYRTRIRLAMARARTSLAGDAPEPLQLLIAAADAARSDTSLRDTIRAAPELAALHADPGADADAVLDATSEQWLGKLHLRAAFVLSQHEDRRDDAKEQLKLAGAWLRAWSASPDGARADFDADDIAHGALAAFLLDDADQARRLARGWRPPQFVREVTRRLLALAPGVVAWPAFAAELEASRASTVVQAQAAVAFAGAGHSVPAAYWRRLGRRLVDTSALAHETWTLDFCLFALDAGVSRTTIRRILDVRAPTVRHLDRYTAAEALLPYLRHQVMRALIKGREPTADTLRPPRLVKGADNWSENESRLYDGVAPGLIALTAVTVRRALDGHDDKTAATHAALNVVERVLAGFRRDPHRRFPEPAFGMRPVARYALWTAVDALPAYPRGAAPPGGSAAEDRLRTLLDELPEIDVDAAPGLLIDAAARMRSRRTAYGLADDMLRKAADAAEAASWPPTDRRDHLLRAARVAVDDATPDTRALSRDLFERAVVIASSLEVDIPARLRCLLRLSTPDSPSERDPQLAARLLKAVEAATSKVEAPAEQLPYALAVGVAAALAPEVGLPAALRWADEDRVGFDEAIVGAVPVALTEGAIDLDQAYTLLALGQPERFSVHLMRATAGRVSGTPAQRRTVTSRLPLWANHVTIDVGSPAAARELHTWMKEDQLKSPAAAAELEAFERARPAGHVEDSSGTSRTWTSPRSVVDVDSVVADASRQDVLEHLRLLRSAYDRDESLHRYLLALGHREEGGRVATLAFVLGLADAPYGCDPETIARVVHDLTREWHTSPSVASWARQSLPGWTARHLTNLFGWVYEPGQYPQQTLLLPCDVDVVRERVWTELARQLDELQSDQLFAAAVSLGRTDLPGEARRTAVTWALDRAQPDAPPAPAPPTAYPPSGTLFSQTLLAVLGHEDARRRWLAAHALRDHLLLTRDTDLPKLLLRLARHAPHDILDAFQLPGALPRPLTALQWLLSALSTAAAQEPALLAPLAADLADIASSTHLPHAAIRELARRTLTRAAPSPELAFVNRPKRSTVEENHRFGNDRDDGNSRFHFSSMDTMPYWYSPLANLFRDVSTTNVAERADAWITDTWARTWDDDCKFDPRVTRRRDAYRLTSNDHGALPVIETAQTYLEYHAMMLVAGGLADIAELERPAYSDNGDPWLEWVNGYLPVEPWKADERVPVPAAPLAIGDGRRLCSQASGSAVPDDPPRMEGPELAKNAAREASRLDVPAYEVLVHSNVHCVINNFSCSAWTESALVNPAAVPSLLTTLELVDSEIHLPGQDDEGPPWGREITVPGLVLKGWLTRQRTPEAAVDREDPTGFGAGAPEHVAPGCDYTTDHVNGTTRGWRQAAWAALDYSRPEHSDSDRPSGAYTAVDRQGLLDYLAGEGMCLLVHASSRVFSSKRYHDSATHIASHYRVLWADGRETDLHGPAETRSSKF